MRKNFLIGVAAATLIAGTTTVAFAYDKNEDRHSRGGHMLERLAEELSLTDDQQASLRSTMKENFSEMRDSMKKHRDSRHALAQLNPNAPDYQAQLDQLIADAQAAAKERVLMKAEHQKEVYAILTPEQQTAFAEFKGEHRKSDRHHGKHHKGCDK